MLKNTKQPQYFKSFLLGMTAIVLPVFSFNQSISKVKADTVPDWKKDILKGYQELYPDAAQKIIDNGIAESQHRREMEDKYLSGNISSHKLGQLFGFLIALVVIIGGIYLIATDKQVAGSVLTGTTALGLIGLFTGNNQNKNKDKE